MTEMTQNAPWPTALWDLVDAVRYKENWSFMLDDHRDRGQGSVGATLVITITTPDSYHPETTRRVAHYFPVPPAAYDRRSWQRWLFEQIVLVETHEAMEFYQIDGERPFAPNHGPGRNPYSILERGTDEDADTSYLGKRNHPDV